MNKKTLIVFLAIASLALFGCPPKGSESGSTGTSANGGGEILVGEYGSLTGPQATFGQSTQTAS